MTTEAASALYTLPEDGMAADALAETMEEAASGDIHLRDGKVRAPIYFAGDDVVEVARRAYSRFILTNGLYTRAFPSVARFEADIVGMTSGLFHNGRAVGSVTSGGTESILLGIKAARDRARAERGITEPEMVVPFSAHPAFNKGGAYFGIKVSRTPLDGDFRVDLAAYRAAVNENTVLMVGSAGNWPFGSVDPIPEMAAIAGERGINFHTDGCLGGFFLPFVEQLGYPVTPFDFRVPGVSSISADLHKYGYTARGASTITWRNDDLAKYQAFEFGDWPSGLYRTPNMSGSRPGGALAAAWAVMHYLGAKGYRTEAARKMTLIRRLQDGVRAIPGLVIFGQPAMCIFAFGSRELDIYAVADGLEDRGWNISRGRDPESIHVMVYNVDVEPSAGEYLQDLEEVVTAVRRGGLVGRGREARYGST